MVRIGFSGENSGICKTSYEQYRQTGPLEAAKSRNLDAVHTRHDIVDYHQVDPVAMLVKTVERLSSTSGLDDIVADISEHLRRGRSYLGIVVDK